MSTLGLLSQVLRRMNGLSHSLAYDFYQEPPCYSTHFRRIPVRRPAHHNTGPRMDSLERFLTYATPDKAAKISAKNDPLKVMSKELLKAAQGTGRDQLKEHIRDGASVLIPSEPQQITLLCLNKRPRMESLERFLTYTPPEKTAKISAKNDPLKVMSKELLKAAQGTGRDQLKKHIIDGASVLIPSEPQQITLLCLNKMIFLWDSFSFVRTCEVITSIVDTTVNYLRFTSQSQNNPETVIKLQRLLRLLISVCQCEVISSPDIEVKSQLEEICTSLTLLVFPPNRQTATDNVELSALAGTALYNVLHAKGDNLHSHYTQSFNSQNQTEFGHVSITAALLNMIKVIPEDQLDRLSSTMMSNTLSFCTGGVNDYHSFSLLQRFMKTPLFSKALLSGESEVVIQELRDLLWANCDSPVEGVSEFVISCLQSLLQTAHKNLNRDTPLHDDLLRAVLPMAWNVRAKLKLLTVLVAWLDCEQLLESTPTLICDIWSCLSSQYLASTSGKLYAAIIQRLGSETMWIKYILQPFIQALNSTNRLVRDNMRHYWLPVTLSLYPAVHQNLISELSDQSEGVSSLPALITVHRECKKTKLITQLHIDDSLTNALRSGNDELRSDVIALICLSSKPSDVITETEVSLLESALTGNMNIDCPAFRHQLISSLQAWLSRIAYYFKYSTAYNTEGDDYLMTHMTWMTRLCYKSLLRGGNFQRKETTLKLSTRIVRLLNSVIEESSQQRCASLSESISKVLAKAFSEQSDSTSEQGSFTVFKQRVINTCLIDSSGEVMSDRFRGMIQKLSYDLLTLKTCPKFAPIWGDVTDYLLSNMDKWRQLIESAKASVAESGALTYTLIYKLLTEEKKKKELVHNILSTMSNCVTDVQTDYHNVVTSHHVYGYMISVEGILNDTDYLSLLSTEELSTLGANVSNICLRSVSTVLDILSLTCQSKDVSPSFEEMETAIEQIITESAHHKGQNVDSGVSSKLGDLGDRVSAWCWLTLKEACCLSGILSRHSIIYRHLLDLSQVKLISDMFYSTLTRCRHRGVIEGSSLGLIQFCHSMINSSNVEFNKTPQAIIDKVLDTVIRYTDSIMTSSVTRRSGGFPIIVQCVLAAENQSKQSHLLHAVVTELLRSCDSLASAEQLDDRTDLPQAHSLNILKALVVDAKLSGSIRQYLSEITMLCIEGFTSPLWALRNAATQLFASCSQRMIGQKRQSDGSVISTSCVELFSQYPNMYKFMLNKLRDSEPGKPDPSIFPILSLLSTLSPCTLSSSQSSYDMEPYRKELRRYMISPIYVVRRLTSLCLTVTVDSWSQISDSLLSFTQAIFTQSSANCIHTTLLTVNSLISSISSQSTRDTSGILDMVSAIIRNRMMIFLTNTSCHVLKTCYLDIVQQVLYTGSHEQSHDRASVQMERLEKWLTEALTSPKTQMPGEGLMLITCSKLLTHISSFDTLLSLLMRISDRQLQSILMDHLVKNFHSQEHCQRVQVWLAGELSSAYSDALMEHLTTSFTLHGVQLSQSDMSKLITLAGKVPTSVPELVVLRVFSLNHSHTVSDTKGTTDLILDDVYDSALPDKSEASRSAAVSCIKIVSQLVGKGHNFSPLQILRILDTLLVLLCDEVSEIRVNAGETTCSLIRLANQLHTKIDQSHQMAIPANNDLHYNNAVYQVLNVLPPMLGIETTAHVTWLTKLIAGNIQHYVTLSEQDRAGQMFFQDELNVYYERPVMIEFICASLHKLGRASQISLRVNLLLGKDYGQLSDNLSGNMKESYLEIMNILNTMSQ